VAPIAAAGSSAACGRADDAARLPAVGPAGGDHPVAATGTADAVSAEGAGPYEVNTTYEPFSDEPEYIEANRAFVRAIGPELRGRLLDLACGTGVMAGLALQQRAGLSVTGLDRSRESLGIARDRLAASGVRALVQGSADALPFGAGVFDAVVMGNAIHMLPDRAALLAEIRRVLVPGGLFAFNGSFYAGTFPAGTESFYIEWIKQALVAVVEADRARRAAGQPGIPRRRGTVAPAFSARWPSPGEWEQALVDHGFTPVSRNERTVIMTQHSLETIGAYAGFAEVLLSGYPPVEASRALQATAGSALRAMGLDSVPRFWLEIVARKAP
jgi:ubiquinone/menaquinone biosynthesis C-methylase UbiE